MKTQLLIIIMLSFSTFNVFAAQEENMWTQAGHFQILQEVKSEVKKCAVMFISSSEDHNVIRSFESKCETLKLHSHKLAQVFVDGNWYSAHLYTSEYADAGDLNNLEIRDQTGHIVATRSHIPAFNNIVLAMTGGDQRLETKFLP
jgi:hypothetical protein